MSFDLIDNGWRKLLKTGQVGHENKKTIVVPNSTTVDGPQLSVQQLIGANVTVKFGDSGCYFLTDPKALPEADWQVGYKVAGGDFVVSYNDNKGLITKPALGIHYPKVACPTFPLNYPEYDSLVFIAEETSDTMGLGLTVQRGWYAFNFTTFAHTPFDLANNPFVVDAFEDFTGNSDEYRKDLEFGVNNFFVKKQYHTFTVQEKNVYVYEAFTGVSAFAVSWSDISALNGSSDLEQIRSISPAVVVGGLDDGGVDGVYSIVKPSGSIFIQYHVEVTYVDSITTMHPKYLPEEAKPKIVDMGEFTVGYGTDTTFNDIILGMVQLSMQKGGVWVTMPLLDIEQTLSKALSKTHNPIIYIYEPSEHGECYVSLATISVGGQCAVASASVPSFMAGISITFDIMFVWHIDSSGGDTIVDIYVKATPFTAESIND